MLTAEDNVADSVYFSLVPLVISCVITFKQKSFKTIFIDDKYSYMVISLSLSILFLIQLNPYRYWSGRLMLGEDYFLGSVFAYIFQFTIYPIMLIISMYINTLAILKYAKNLDLTGVESLKQKKIDKYIYPQTVAIAGFSIMFVLAAYPYIPIPDADYIYTIALNNIVDEWHTIGYLAFVKACLLIGQTPYLVIIMQMLFLIFVNNKAIDVLYQYTKSIKTCNLYMIASLVIFTPYYFMIFMMKDSMFTTSLFAIGILITEILFSDKIKKSSIIMLTIFSSFASLLRHAGVFSVIIPLVLLMYFFFFKRRHDLYKIAISTLVVLCTYFFATKILLINILSGTPNPEYVSYTMPMQLAGAVVSSDVILADEDLEVLESITPLVNWKERYNKYFADPLSRDWVDGFYDIYKLNDKKYQSALINLNARFLIRHPIEYIKGLANISSIIWEFGDPLDYILMSYSSKSDYYNRFTGEFHHTAATGIVAQLIIATSNMPILRSILWRGGTWMFVLILSVCLLCCYKKTKFLIAVSPVIVMILLLFLSIPAQGTRYILPVISYAIFFIIFSLSGKRLI
jgi:hypothetical protein